MISNQKRSLSQRSKYPSQSVLEIRVSCRNVPGLGTTTEQKQEQGVDTFGVLHLSEHPPRFPVPHRDPLSIEMEVGRTEVIPRNNNPDFVRAFRIAFHFEEEQHLCFRLYHERPYFKEPETEEERYQVLMDLHRHEFIGGIHFTLGQLLGAVGNSLALPLHRGQHKGFAVLHARPTKESSEVLRFQIAASKIKPSSGIFSALAIGKKRRNLHYSIQQLNPTTMTWSSVLNSSAAKQQNGGEHGSNLSPKWNVEEVRIQQLCAGDYNKHIRIQIVDVDTDNGTHEDMGGVVMTVDEMLQAPNTFTVLKAIRRSGQNREVGSMTVISADILNRPTLVDYITGGCQISMQVAVDFTLSNGQPSDPKSLHYRHKPKQESSNLSSSFRSLHPREERLNDYQQVMRGLGRIVQAFDAEKQFPLWAFGAKINHHKEDCLELGRGTGVEGLLDAYSGAFDIPGFDLSGPTNLVPVLRAAADAAMAQVRRGKQTFSILFILTDGVATDMEQASDMICRIAESGVPIYIVIVGIGKSDFKPMLVFGDGAIRDRHGKLPVRDIVSFIPFKNNTVGNMTKLAAEVLHAIPKQIVDFHLTRNIKPNAPVAKPYFTEEKVFGK